MQIAEIMPMLHQLSRADKYRVLQLLTSELADAEDAVLNPRVEYPGWSPCDSFDAASTLSQYCRENSEGS
jgi:hypothetical protein